MTISFCFRKMGKRQRSCTGDVELKVKDKKIKPSLFGETPKKIMNKKNKKLTNLKNPLAHKLVVEKLDESEHKLSTKQNNENSRDLINKATAKVSEGSNLLVSSPCNKAKVKRENRSNELDKNKKIKFTDGEPDTETANTELLREEDVKDEDIDKFCDEITEEDNKQYENWIELLEAKLGGNKKKTK